MPDSPRASSSSATGSWQDYGLSDGTVGPQLDPSLGPVWYAPGVLGMPVMTAYIALIDIGKPRPGEPVVSAAAGAVGSVVGQVARILGCRAVGIAGCNAKCRYLDEELGLDAYVDYKAKVFDQALAAACSDGADVYFDDVRGKVRAAVPGVSIEMPASRWPA